MNITMLASGSSPQELNKMLEPFGDYNVGSDCDGSQDVIIAWSVSQMPMLERAVAMFPHIPVINYNWDVYEWVWSQPRENEYDYKRYGELLKDSLDVWVPSECTAKRTKQWFDKEAHVITSSVPYYEHDNIRDEGYVLNPLREIPDPSWGMFEEACGELGIPYKSTLHEIGDKEEYKDVVAGCTFTCSPLHELSTGGLTCFEAYYLGKPMLMSDSEWHGGRDYMGDRAVYFKDGDKKDLKDKLKKMWNNTPKVPTDHKKWMRDTHSDKVMGEKIHKRLQEIL